MSLLEARIDDFASAANGWFWETDQENRFTYLSPSVEDVTGVKAEWHYGKTREDIGSPEGVSEADWEAHLRTIRERKPFRNFVYRRVGPNRSQWLRTSGRPIIGSDGLFMGFRGIGTDITAEVVVSDTVEELARDRVNREGGARDLRRATNDLVRLHASSRDSSAYHADNAVESLASIHTVLSALQMSKIDTLDDKTSEHLDLCNEVLENVIDSLVDATGSDTP